MPKLIVSIVTWNSALTIRACVESVLKQSFSDFQLIIVDNNSKDHTCELIESFKDNRMRLIRNSENTGFCGGHNFSINQSESEFVLLVNPDIIMKENYVSVALALMEGNPKIGTVCGLLLQSDLSDPKCKIDSAGLELKRSRVMRMNYHGMLLRSLSLKTEEVFGADGALPMYRRSMIDGISCNNQFFDELFFAHKEDWDVSWRSHLYGWKTVFNPECVAIHPRHFKPKSLKVRSEVDSAIKIHSVKNQLILLLKNQSFSDFIKNSVFIIPRQLIVFLYILFAERTSLQAYRFIFNNFSVIMGERKIIQAHRKLNKL